MTKQRSAARWGLLLLVHGCAAEPARLAGEPAPGAATTPLTTASPIQEVHAIDHQRYPDSLGFLYQGELATVLWLDNELPMTGLDDLAHRLGRGIESGLRGEFLTNAMRHVEPTPSAEPSLAEMARRAVQSSELLAQYAFVAQDYGSSLGDALATYNTDPSRLAGLAAAAARIDATFAAVTAPRPPAPLPTTPPPPDLRSVRPGRYFADAVRAGQLRHLQASTRALQRALAAKDPVAYGRAFTELFLAQLDADLARDAHEALASSHGTDGELRGQPLDAAVADLVLRAGKPGTALELELLRVTNQINLLSAREPQALRAALAALLVLGEDHRHGEQDPDLAPASIWAHVHDPDWLIAQYVRLKADGTTTQAALAMLDSLVAANTAR